MSKSQIWIDEVDLRYWEPSADPGLPLEPSISDLVRRMHFVPETNKHVVPSYHNAVQAMVRNQYWIGVESMGRQTGKLERQRQELKARRTKEQRNCLHGRRPYVINWAPGVHPLGPREFWVNIAGIAGGPYLLNDEDHEILHSVKRDHEHVRTRHIKRYADSGD